MLEPMDEFFNRRADGFDGHMLSIENAGEFYPLTAKALFEIPGRDVLDLGCGTGLELDFYWERDPLSRVTCVDVAGELLSQIPVKHPNSAATLVQADYFQANLGENAFDKAVSVESLHHFSREKKTELYRKILRALRPGGAYVETDYIAPDDETEARLFSEADRLRAEEGLCADAFVHIDTPHTVEHLLEMRRDAGFARSVCLYRASNAAVIVSYKAREYAIRPVALNELPDAVNVIAEGRRAIASLGIDQWQDGHPTAETLKTDILQKRLFGAYDENGLCAVAAFCAGEEPCYAAIDGRWVQNEPYLTVHRMAALDRSRHTGAAAALMRAAERCARELGLSALRADTHRGNAVMRRFLTKQGFVLCGVVDYSPDISGDPLRAAYEKPVKS